MQSSETPVFLLLLHTNIRSELFPVLFEMSIKDYFKTSVIDLVDDGDENSAILTQREKEEVTKQLKQLKPSSSGKRGTYLRMSIEEKQEIGNYAKSNGIPATLRKFKTKYPRLSRQTVHDYRKVINLFEI